MTSEHRNPTQAENGPQRTIWKFEVDLTDSTTVQLPEGARVLRVAPKDLRAYWLWAIVDPEAPRVSRTFHARGTGHPLGEVGEYIGTIDISQFVFHIFEGSQMS